jgi:DNA polymerase III subunit epsilon
MNITALDFETANNCAAGICSAGIAAFVDGQLTESRHWLIRPPKGHGYFNVEFTKYCHGISWRDVPDSPEFPAIAPELLRRLTRADIVVAHNAAFDMGKLRSTLEHFSMAYPAFDYLCTLRLSKRVWPDLPRHSLDAVAAHIGHQFQHHRADSDAEAAGRVMLAAMRDAGALTSAELCASHGLQAQRF